MTPLHRVKLGDRGGTTDTTSAATHVRSLGSLRGATPKRGTTVRNVRGYARPFARPAFPPRAALRRKARTLVRRYPSIALGRKPRVSGAL